MKLFVTGSDGLVGSRFLELKGDSFEITALEIDDLDLTDKERVKDYFSKNSFDGLVHFAAYTDVGKAEEQRGNRQEACWRVNVEGTRNLVEAINPIKTHFVYISTDMVFSGSEEDPGPYSENHQIEEYENKVTWYGFSKGQGERVVRKVLDDNMTILRLIYPVRAKYEKKLDYLRKPLKLFDEGKLYPLFNDQQISITFIDELSAVIEKILKDSHFGTFHASSKDMTNPHEIVSYLIKRVRESDATIESTTVEEFLKRTSFPSVRYPKHGGLQTGLTEKELGMDFGTWREIVDKLIEQGIGG
jgi:dTDP-4-dehydrorhamnose reductase